MSRKYANKSTTATAPSDNLKIVHLYISIHFSPSQQVLKDLPSTRLHQGTEAASLAPCFNSTSLQASLANDTFPSMKRYCSMLQYMLDYDPFASTPERQGFDAFHLFLRQA